ncbi:hypothetical protein DPMN_177196 [Dreissena polymorpha]|uniref:Uncharacterized protein n=1 Tax=Dreissena polymorpha TaxID=45954 RepID=A0A9D4ILE3_DREPO|nr:hypothetical protein DPMN_177196 [Dreissena polymorpha]
MLHPSKSLKVSPRVRFLEPPHAVSTVSAATRASQVPGAEFILQSKCLQEFPYFDDARPPPALADYAADDDSHDDGGEDDNAGNDDTGYGRRREAVGHGFVRIVGTVVDAVTPE